MYSKKTVKKEQKPSLNHPKQHKIQSKVILEKKDVSSRSLSKSSIRSRQDSQILVRKALKNTQYIQKKLKDDSKRKHQQKKRKQNQMSVQSNSSRTNSSCLSITSLEKQKRLQFHKQRSAALTNIKQNTAQDKRSISKVNEAYLTHSKKPLVANQSKNTKSETKLVQNMQKKASKKIEKILQNNKPITGYFSKKDPSNLSETVSVNSSTGTRKQKTQLNKSKDLSNKSRQVSNQSRNQKNKLKVNQTKSINLAGQKSHKNLSITSQSVLREKDSKKESQKVLKAQKKPVFDNNRTNVLMKNIESKNEESKSNSISRSLSKISQSSLKQNMRGARKSSKRQAKQKTTEFKNQHPKHFQIPVYSLELMQKIEDQLINFDEQQENESVLMSYKDSIIWLMSWIWEAEMPNYNQIKAKKKIDVIKCLRKLFEFYEKTKSSSKMFYDQVFIDKIQFQADLYFENQNIGQKSKSSQKMEIQQSDSEEKYHTPKNFMIYELFRNWKNDGIGEVKTLIIVLFIEIIIYNYGSIVGLDDQIPFKVLRHFRAMNIENNFSISQFEQKLYQQLTVYSFTELSLLKVTVSRSPYFLNKKKLEELLWKFFMEILRISHKKIKAKQLINFGLTEANVLQTAYYLACQFTHYMKRFTIKNIESQINIIQVECFLQILVERIIEFNVYVLQLKDRQRNLSDIQIGVSNKLYQFRFDLLLYDWAILSIKCEERKTFQNIVKHCKKLFLKNLEKKSTSKYETYKNKAYVNDKYARFTIQQVAEEQKSFDEQSNFQQKLHQDQPSGYKITHDKVKTFVSIPHMSFLLFKEFIPISVKRQPQQRKSNNHGQKIESHLLYLLILSNSQYLLKLILQIQCTQIQLLGPDIGRGLIRLCNYCHDFKSLILGQKYLRILGSNNIHKELMERMFEKDIDYQRRLSSSILNQIPTGKFNNIPEAHEKDDKKQNKELQKKQLSDYFQVRVKSCETMYFEMIMEIENVIPLINLNNYIQQLLKNPNIFRADKFYVKLLENQHISSARQYLNDLIIRYIDDELRLFDLMAYFQIFAGHCLKIQNFSEMAHLIQSLPITKLIKFHSLLFSQTLSDHISFRIQIPEGISRQEKLNILTSAGYEERTRFLDTYCTEMAETIMWRKYLKPIVPFEKIEKYICIKSYFTIIHEIYSDSENSSKSQEHINFLIERLKTWIQKDKIDEVASTFHFLSLALFPRQKQSGIYSTLSKNLSRDSKKFFGSRVAQNNAGIEHRFTEQIFYMIGQHTEGIIEMYKNKESLTMRCLGEEMRKRQNNELDDRLDQIKRKQVSKMLNKMKNAHDYLVKCIIRFIENANYTPGFLKNFHGPEDYLSKISRLCRCEHIGKGQKTHQALKEFHTPKLNFSLSQVSSNHSFDHTFRRQMKRYDQNPMQLIDRYSFLVMVRLMAEKWIEQKLQTSKDQLWAGDKSKATKLSQKFPSKSKNKHNKWSESSMISIDKIFEVCIQSINRPVDSRIGVRECQILKQKLIALQILGLLYNCITNKCDILKFMASSFLKTYKTKFHPQLSKIIINLLMNNANLLGKEERDLIVVIRLKALALLIQSYKNPKTFSEYQWKLVSNKQQFWFIINTLAFDSTIQIRFLIIKSLYSRYAKNQAFRQSIIELLTISQLIAVQQPIKSFAQVAKKCLTETLTSQFEASQPKLISILNSSVLQFYSFLANFNTVHILQRKEKKFNERQFLMVLVDMIFDKKEFEQYLYMVIDYFKKIIGNRQKVNIAQIFKQVKWSYDFNVDFYMISKVFNFKSTLMDMEMKQNKAYLELLQEIGDQSSIKKSQKLTHNNRMTESKKQQSLYDQKYPNSKQVFKDSLEQTLKILEEVFLQRSAKSNKKIMKTKKPQSIFKNLGTVFTHNVKQQKLSLIKHEHSTGKKKKETDTEIDI